MPTMDRRDDETQRTRALNERIASLETRVNDGFTALRERVESRAKESLDRFRHHESEDERRFASIDNKLDAMRVSVDAKLDKITDVVTATRVHDAATHARTEVQVKGLSGWQTAAITALVTTLCTLAAAGLAHALGWH